MLHERSVEVLPPVFVLVDKPEVSPLSLNERQKRRLECLASVLEGLGYHTTIEELASQLNHKPFDISILGPSVKEDPFALPRNVLSSPFLESFRSPTYRTGGELTGDTLRNAARVFRHLGMVHADNFLQQLYGLSLNDLFRPDLNHPAFAYLKEGQREALSNFREHLAGLFSSKETPPDGKMLKEYATSVVELQQVDCWAQGVKEKYPNKNFVGFVPLIEKKTGRLAGIMPEIGEGPPGLRLGTLWWVTDRVSGLCLRSRETAAHPPDPLSSLGNKLIELVDSIVKPPPDRKPTRRRLAPRLTAAVTIGVLGLTSAACAEPTGSPAPPTTPVEDTSSRLQQPQERIPYAGTPKKWEHGIKLYEGVGEIDTYYYDSYVNVGPWPQIKIRLNNPWGFHPVPNPDSDQTKQEELGKQTVLKFQSDLRLMYEEWPGTFHPPSVINILPGHPTGVCLPPNKDKLPKEIPIVWATTTGDIRYENIPIEFSGYGSAVMTMVLPQFQFDAQGNVVAAPEVAVLVVYLVPEEWCRSPEEEVFAIRARFHELTHLVAFEEGLRDEVPVPLKEGVATYVDLTLSPKAISKINLAATAIMSELNESLTTNLDAAEILTAVEQSGRGWTYTPEKYRQAARAVAALQAADKRFLPEITAISKEDVEEKGSFVNAAKEVLSRLNLTEEQRQLALWLLGQ